MIYICVFFSRLFIWKFVKLQLEIANVFDNYYWKEIFRLVFKFIYKQRTNGIDRINSNLAHVYLQGSFSFLTQRILLRPTHANRIDVIPHHYLNFYCVLKRVTRIPPRRYIKLQKLEKISQPKSKTMKHWKTTRSSPPTNVPSSSWGETRGKKKLLRRTIGTVGRPTVKSVLFIARPRGCATPHARASERVSLNTRVVAPTRVYKKSPVISATATSTRL